MNVNRQNPECKEEAFGRDKGDVPGPPDRSDRSEQRVEHERHAGLDHRLEVCGGVAPSAALHRGLQSITENRRQLVTRRR